MNKRLLFILIIIKHIIKHLGSKLKEILPFCLLIIKALIYPGLIINIAYIINPFYINIIKFLLGSEEIIQNKPEFIRRKLR